MIGGLRRSIGTRALYVALALGTIGLGLVVHWHGEVLGPAARDALGDALWAMMIMWWTGAIAPEKSLRARVAAAVAFCFVIEVSQLYHTTFLDGLRGTTVGHLVLGNDFDVRDLAAYTLGVVSAALLELATRRRRTGAGFSA